MKQYFIKAAAACLCCLLPSAWAAAADDCLCLTEKEQLRVAETFLEQGEYYRAVTEYKRFLILFPESERLDEAWLGIGKAYYGGRDFPEAGGALAAVSRDMPQSDLAAEALFYRGLSLWKGGDLKGAAGELGFIAERYPGSPYAPLGLAAGSLAALEDNNIAGARDRLAVLIDGYAGHPAAAGAPRTLEFLDKMESLPRRSEILAGIMSAVVPGSGYAYAGRYGDGATAFFLNAVCIIGALAGLREESYALAAVVGTVGLALYAGNIYGSAAAAGDWNERAKTELLDRIVLTLEFRY